MGKPFKLTGTTEQQFKQLETVMKHLLRRTIKTTTFATPPVPLSFYSALMGSNETFKYLNTLSGKVKEFYFYYDRIKDVDEIIFNFNVLNTSGKTTHGLITQPGKLTVVKKEVLLAAGDKITIDHEHDGEVIDLWIGFPIFPDKGNFDYTKLAIDTLLAEAPNEGI